MHRGQVAPHTHARYLWEVLGETVELVADLEGQLTHVGEHKDLHLALGHQLVEGGQHEHGGLAHARLCLAQHIHAQQSLGNALVLHCFGGARTRRRAAGKNVSTLEREREGGGRDRQPRIQSDHATHLLKGAQSRSRQWHAAAEASAKSRGSR